MYMHTLTYVYIYIYIFVYRANPSIICYSLRGRMNNVKLHAMPEQRVRANTLHFGTGVGRSLSVSGVPGAQDRRTPAVSFCLCALAEMWLLLMPACRVWLCDEDLIFILIVMIVCCVLCALCALRCYIVNSVLI